MEVTLHGSASFHSGNCRWTSKNAAVTFVVKKRRSGIFAYAKRVWRQSPKTTNGRMAKPHFKPVEWDRLKNLAIAKFLRRRSSARGTAQTWIVAEDTAAAEEADKNHIVELCELCAHLGYCCRGLTIETLEGVFYRINNPRQLATRRERLEATSPMTLYHQTDPAAARAILASQEMRKGSAGSLGAGIYFAESIAATDRKTQHRGVVLQCKVKMGREKEYFSACPSISFRSLILEGYDSVIGKFFQTGTEYVVYNHDQVFDITCVRGDELLI